MSLGDAGRPDPKELRARRAVAHPVRLRILSLLTGVELSAAEVAREIGITQANASYHLRLLADAGELQISGTEKVRGGVAKKYRYVAGADLARQRGRRRPEDGHQGLRDDLQQHRVALDAELRRRIPTAIGDGSFADAEVWLDPEDWAQAKELVEQAARLVHDRAHPPRTPGTTHVSFVSWLFTMESDNAHD